MRLLKFNSFVTRYLCSYTNFQPGYEKSSRRVVNNHYFCNSFGHLLYYTSTSFTTAATVALMVLFLCFISYSMQKYFAGSSFHYHNERLILSRNVDHNSRYTCFLFIPLRCCLHCPLSESTISSSTVLPTEDELGKGREKLNSKGVK